MSPPRIALVTCKHRKEPDPDEHLLLSAVHEAGLECEWIAWDDEDHTPEAFDLCVLRTTWNFYENVDAFRAWIDRAARGSRLLNPAPLVHANLHKGYLEGLEARGLPVIPTRWSPKGRPLAIDAPAEHGIVVKPCISASSFGTRRFGPDELDAARAFASEMAKEHDMMVQPAMEGFVHPGERSLVWIDGAFTHAVTKRARYAGDAESIARAGPLSELEQAFGARVLATTDTSLFYARVDMILEAGRPVLSELELIEPSLFLRHHPPAHSPHPIST